MDAGGCRSTEYVGQGCGAARAVLPAALFWRG